MMENHSYDNHFGMLQRAGADGFRLGWNGKPLASNPYPEENPAASRGFAMLCSCPERYAEISPPMTDRKRFGF